jgi:hypothetical protein
MFSCNVSLQKISALEENGAFEPRAELDAN